MRIHLQWTAVYTNYTAHNGEHFLVVLHLCVVDFLVGSLQIGIEPEVVEGWKGDGGISLFLHKKLNDVGSGCRAVFSRLRRPCSNFSSSNLNQLYYIINERIYELELS